MTALSYLLVAVVVAAALFGIAVVVFGRGEELPPLPPRATPTRLPEGNLDGGHLRELRFPQAVRGYRMDDVDWVLERLADELDRVGVERDGLAARISELESANRTRAVPRVVDRDSERTGPEPADRTRAVPRVVDRDSERTGPEPADRTTAVPRVGDRNSERTGPAVRAEGSS